MFSFLSMRRDFLLRLQKKADVKSIGLWPDSPFAFKLSGIVIMGLWTGESSIRLFFNGDSIVLAWLYGRV